MKKLESTFINMVVVLVGFTAMAAAMLGSVYELTKTPIVITSYSIHYTKLYEVLISGVKAFIIRMANDIPSG